ncbi:MAG: hypothetical protein FWC42_08245 [Proteobacteria bacterium]|nr:hypothetical protein [Pseudomonadota bacterium]
MVASQAQEMPARLSLLPIATQDATLAEAARVAGVGVAACEQRLLY